jgi:catechol 2,3-dioxygenase-like lactoylglutathione lyase family enzyme
MIELRHTGIVVTDMELALHFYRDLLGLKVVKVMEESGEFLDELLGLKDVKVTTVKLSAGEGGSLLELLHFKSHPLPRSGVRAIYGLGPSHIAFTVSDLKSVYARLSNAGISFTSAPVLSPDGLARVVFCLDPEGTHLEIVEQLDTSPGSRDSVHGNITCE